MENPETTASPEMSPREALVLLDHVVARVPGTRLDHERILKALATVEVCLGLKWPDAE